MDEKYFEKPIAINEKAYRFDAFKNGDIISGKKGRVPAMGWNSWNAFGSGNTEASWMTDATDRRELTVILYPTA